MYNINDIYEFAKFDKEIKDIFDEINTVDYYLVNINYINSINAKMFLDDLFRKYAPYVVVYDMSKQGYVVTIEEQLLNAKDFLIKLALEKITEKAGKNFL